jgi:NADH-quinone oxidoreductase subunit M
MLPILLISIPFVFSLLLLLLKGNMVKQIALLGSLVTFGVSLYTYNQYNINSADPNLIVNNAWIVAIGSNFSMSIDGVSVILVLLTGLLVPLIVYSAFERKYENEKYFYSLMLMMEAALLGVFMAMDGFLFYIFWELALIPIYFICLFWGGENRSRITFKFFIYTLLGSLFMLISLIYVYLHTTGSPHSFAIVDLYNAGKTLSQTEQIFVFWGMFIAFGIKMPIFPFHTWQPETYYVAPTQGTMLLSGIMLKMGTYGLIRWLIPLVPKGVYQSSDVVVTLSIIGIIYASSIAIVQKDFKKLLAYSSIAHVGLISAGIMTMKMQGLHGGLIQMFAHGINIVGLFFICDIILRRLKKTEIEFMGGIRSVEPQFAVLFLIVLLGSVALPLTNGFVGEFLLINSLYQYQIGFAIPAGLTIILGAVYMFRAYQGIMLGEANQYTVSFSPLSFNEKLILIIISCLILFFGLFPGFLLNTSEATLKQIIDIYKVGLN